MRATAFVFGVAAAVMLASVALTYSWGDRVLRLREEEDARRHALLTIDDVFSTLQDAETGQRGFVITGDENYLQPFEAARARLPQAFAQLNQTAKIYESGSDTTELRRLSRDKLNELTESIEARRRGGFEAAAAIVQSGAGKASMDQIRVVVARMRALQEERLTQQSQMSAFATQMRTAVFASTGSINLLVLAWGFIRLRRANIQRNSALVARERQADLLGTTLASIGDCVIVTDPCGHISFMNAVAAALSGWGPSDAIGRPVKEIFQIINEHTREPVEDPVEKVIKHGVTVGLGNHNLLIRKDGSEVPIDDSGAPIRSASGEFEGVVLVFRDFSVHKESERALREAKNAAESASAAKDKFLATLSHELRTPLTPVLATLNLWEMSESLPRDLRDDVLMMRRNVELEARIIDDLLDLTRIVRGMLTMLRERVDVHSLIKLLVDLTRGDAEAKHLRVTQEFSAKRHFVIADSGRLQQLLWNVLRNAINFTDARGAISIRTANEGEQLAISIQDSGIGMTPQTLTHLFTPFEQADHQRSRIYGGLGLGLSISRALAEMMGGTIEAESAGIGHGSTFVVRLNAVDEVAMNDGASKPVSAAHTRRRILVVEDHPDTALTLTRLLQVRGHQVRTASSAAAGMSEAVSGEFDLILCDIGLPDGTGYDVITEIRKTKSVPAVALTGFGMSSDMERATAAGFNAHLTKPVNFVKLESTIAELFARDGVAAGAPNS